MAASLQQAIEQQQLPLEIVRNGSRGMYWLEPLIEEGIAAPIHLLRQALIGYCAVCRVYCDTFLAAILKVIINKWDRDVKRRLK